MRNYNPTKLQAQGLRDMQAYPNATFEERSRRMKITRAGVHERFLALEKKALLQRNGDGTWALTPAGNDWLRRNPRRALMRSKSS